MRLGVVAIVGRPNVGKSTLFNALVKERKALVDDLPGVTRDRQYGVVTDGDTDSFMVIDTGGFETKDSQDDFPASLVWQQSNAAIEESDLVVMVFDGRAGLQPYDIDLVRRVTKTGKPVLFCINKIDGIEHEDQALADFYRLGVETFHTLSAAHNRGVGDLRETIMDSLTELQKASGKKTRNDPDEIKLALVGRPNVGKSSILNRLLGCERALVSEIAGTTRDSIDSHLTYDGRPLVIMDTAGMRRRTKIKQKIETLSVVKSMAAIEDADVVVLIIDAQEGLTDQDARLATMAAEQYKPLMIVVNKWDLITGKETNSAREYERDLKDSLRTLEYAPVLFASCLENQRIQKILPTVVRLFDQSRHRVSTSDLNEELAVIVQAHTPALMRALSKRSKFYFATQVSVRPPTIVVKCNVAELIQESYKRYMTNKFRKNLGFTNVPVRLIFRGKVEEPKKATGKYPATSVKA